MLLFFLISMEWLDIANIANIFYSTSEKSKKHKSFYKLLQETLGTLETLEPLAPLESSPPLISQILPQEEKGAGAHLPDEIHKGAVGVKIHFLWL